MSWWAKAILACKSAGAWTALYLGGSSVRMQRTNPPYLSLVSQVAFDIDNDPDNAQIIAWTTTPW